MDITKEEASKMKESLSGIIDWRRQSGHLLHKLIDVLLIGLTTVLAGWCEYTMMEDFPVKLPCLKFCCEFFQCVYAPV
jgi:hypothetical protein